jgi:hypothetical protein
VAKKFPTKKMLTLINGKQWKSCIKERNVNNINWNWNIHI